MTDVALIDHSTRFERVWGVIVGDDRYRADVLVLPLANELPPDWFLVELVTPPEGVTLVDWFMFGLRPHVAQRACELISAKLTPVTDAEFAALEEAHRPAAPSPPEPTLTAEDFAGPNRAQRRAQETRPKRRRR